MNRNVHKIDATGKTLGRLATQVAVLLRGKDKVTYQPNQDQGDFVHISNVGEMKITGKKLEQKKYYRHSGYPGGIKEVNLQTKMEKDPKFVLRNAVMHMLPDNKLRSCMIKRLVFINGKKSKKQ